MEKYFEIKSPFVLQIIAESIFCTKCISKSNDNEWSNFVFGKRWWVNLIKNNLCTEYVESTFLLLEAYLPRFFSGLLHFYRRSKNNEEQSSSTNKTIADKTRRIGSLSGDNFEHQSRVLLQNDQIIALDLDIYEFAMQRFQKQLLSLITK